MASPTSTKASQIGWMFVPQYYTFVNKDPARLHCFYTKRSTLIHGVEGEDSQPCYGQQEVHEKIMSLGFEDCKVFVSTVDSQSSAEGGIIIQVVGELSNKGGPWRKFAQTFFLAEQPNGYFVLNDIFRYIKEESDDDEAVNADAASAAPAASPAVPAATSGQQEVTYDQLANAAIVGGQQQSQNAAATHDFELAQQHGNPAEAAGVTVAPPIDSQQQESRSSLEGLVNGQTEQPVVELHDDLADSSTASVQQQQQQQQTAAAAAPAEQVNGDHSEEAATAATAAIVPTEVEAPSSAADPASAIAEQIQTKPEQQSLEAAPSTSAPAAPAQTPAAPAAAPVQETSKPSGPKTWASLAATAGGQWRGNVASKATGVSSAAASSAGASRSATPAQKPESSTAGGASGASNAGSAPREQRAQQGSRNAETRTPNFTNVETDYSIIVTNITENISHGLLRQRLSDEFAQQHGNKREWAKLSYLDIDRQKSIAYVDFEKEWAMKKAVEKGSCTIDGTTVNIAAGKGNRRDASGLGTSRPSQSQGGAGGAPSQGGPKGRGDGQRQGQGQGRGGGPGAGRGSQQRPQRGGKAGGDKQ